MKKKSLKNLKESLNDFSKGIALSNSGKKMFENVSEVIICEISEVSKGIQIELSDDIVAENVRLNVRKICWNNPWSSFGGILGYVNINNKNYDGTLGVFLKIHWDTFRKISEGISEGFSKKIPGPFFLINIRRNFWRNFKKIFVL